jgi:hypothetical protein
MVAGLGALFALVLAAEPVREFFDLVILSAGQWFLAMLSAAAGLVLASVVWRLPAIQRLEEPDRSAEPRPEPEHDGVPGPTHTPVTEERPPPGVAATGGTDVR